MASRKLCALITAAIFAAFLGACTNGQMADADEAEATAEAVQEQADEGTAHQYLSAGKVRELMAGNTVKDGRKWKEYYRTNGKAKGYSSGFRYDDGLWSVESTGKLCLFYPRATQYNWCRFITFDKTNNTVTYYKNGEVTGTATLYEGNAL